MSLSSWNVSVAAAGICVQTQHPLFLIGPPGIGKTAIMNGLARRLGREFYAVLLGIRDPTDIGGLPTIQGDHVRALPFEWAHRFSEAEMGDRPGLIFFDEIDKALPAQQTAALRILQEGYVGDTRLGRKVARAAALNSADEGGSFLLQAPLANRGVHIPLQADAEVFCSGLVAGFPDPEVPRVPESYLETHGHEGVAVVAGFIHVNRSALHDLPRQDHLAAGPWPSPRTWEMVARLWAAWRACDAGPDVLHVLVSGAVGEARAMELRQYSQDLDLPDPEQVLLRPEAILAALPARGDRQYAVLQSVVAAVLNRCTPERWLEACAVCRVAAKKCPDMAALAVRSLLRQRPVGVALPDDILVFEPMLAKAGLIEPANRGS
jgi:hypothetical protein